MSGYIREKIIDNLEITSYLVDNLDKISNCYEIDLYFITRFDLMKSNTINSKFHDILGYENQKIDILLNDEIPSFSDSSYKDIQYLNILVQLDIPTKVQVDEPFAIIGTDEYIKSLGYHNLKGSQYYTTHTPMKCIKVDKEFNFTNKNKEMRVCYGNYIIFRGTNDMYLITQEDFKNNFKLDEHNNENIGEM